MNRDDRRVDDALLRSALAVEGAFLTVDEFLAWFATRGKANRFLVEEIPFAELDKWHFTGTPCRLVHASGKFFSVEGLRVKTTYGLIRQWDQPIINQPEIGILGILVKEFDGVYCCLMQAKMEPGNVNTIQLSPTVQATKSNYTQVHQGKLPLYLEYFIDRKKATVLIDQLQPEQGARFLGKRNRNMVVEVTSDVPVHEDFCWLTVGQIRRLLEIPNLVNMDARTVISCMPLVGDSLRREASRGPKYGSGALDAARRRLTRFHKALLESMITTDSSVHSEREIISWYVEMKSRYDLSVESISLDKIEAWVRTPREIRHVTGKYFSVIAVSVEAGSREVVKWTQPLLKQTGLGLVGFIAQEINGVLHFLVRGNVEPGNRDVMLMGPTVACSSWIEGVQRKEDLPFLADLFLEAQPEWIRYAAVQSEEGGRFYHFQNRYMIVELLEGVRLDLPENFVWLTLGQITDFAKHGYFNIEARNLLSCLNIFYAQAAFRGPSEKGQAK